MKTAIFTALAKVTMIVGAFSILTSTGAGQSVSADTPRGIAVAAKRQALADSIGLFRSGNFDRAEAALVAGNRRKPGTPQWSVESGCALMRLALEFRDNGDGVVALEAAERALQHFTRAQKKFGASDDPAEVANLYELMGVVYEELLGDRDAAKASYTVAVHLAPSVGQAATLLAKLQEESADEQRKARR